MSKNMKRVLSGLVVALSFALGACADKPSSELQLFYINDATREAAKTDPKIAIAVENLEENFDIWGAIQKNDGSMTTSQFALKKNAKGTDDMKMLGGGTDSTLGTKIGVAATGAAINAAGVIGGAVALGKTMPGNSTVNCLKQGQSQATSGVAGNVNLNPC